MTAMALFDEPPRITINNPDAANGSRVGLLLGFTWQGSSSGGGLSGIFVAEDGAVLTIPAQYLSVDFRYNVETDRFEDSNMPNPAQEG